MTDQQPPSMAHLEERTARAIAWAHFDRKYCNGNQTKASRNAYYADKNWRTFVPAARLVLCVLAEEAGKS